MEVEWLASIKRLDDGVKVLRPRKVISEDIVSRINRVTFSELAREVLECFDFPWGRSGRTAFVAAPVFVTDLAERRRFEVSARSLLARMVGAAIVVPEAKGFLVTGPVGCGKSTLTSLLALSVTALWKKSILVHFECSGQAGNVFFSEIIAAGMLKAGIVSEEELRPQTWNLRGLQGLSERKGVDVILFVDETQRLFGGANQMVMRHGGPVLRSKELEDEVNSLESVWPTSFLSGSASSLKSLFFNPGEASSTLFPSKMMRPVNDTKFRSTAVHRLVDSSSIGPVVADIDRQFQLVHLVNTSADLERDSDGMPIDGSEHNRRWLLARVDELSDGFSGPAFEERSRARAAAYLRKFLWDGEDDDQMLFFIALLYSRGVPRTLKVLQEAEHQALSGLTSFVPDLVRLLWLNMARFLHLAGDATVQASLNDAIRNLDSMTYLTSVLSEVAATEDLSLFRIRVEDLLVTIPGATIPNSSTLAEWVDRGFILWDSATNSISFASVADYALTRLSSMMEVRQFKLLSLLFNESGKEHERIAVSSIKDAAELRFDDPRVRHVLERLGLVSDSSSWVDERAGKTSLAIHVLWDNVNVPFPTVDAFQGSVSTDVDVPKRKRKSKQKVKGGISVREETASGKRLSVSDILVREAEDACTTVLHQALSASSLGIELTPMELREFISIGDSSSLNHLASTRSDATTRSVHEAFGLDPKYWAKPIIFKPHPDDFRVDWIVVNPDESMSVIQMKHGGSSVSERDAVAAVAAGAKVLRAWLAHRGVPNWETLTIHPVMWTTRPTVESQWVSKQTHKEGSIAALVGVEWLTKGTIAPIWSSEAIQIMFNGNKEKLWGVETEMDRAKAELATQPRILALLNDAARGITGEISSPSGSWRRASPASRSVEEKPRRARKRRGGSPATKLEPER